MLVPNVAIVVIGTGVQTLMAKVYTIRFSYYSQTNDSLLTLLKYYYKPRMGSFEDLYQAS